MKTIVDLAAAALEVRIKILEMCYKSGGHISTSLSCVEILVLLYSRFLNGAESKKISDRNCFVMSKGHGETALYAVLNSVELIPDDWIHSHYRDGLFHLGGHVDSSVPGVDFTTGALGHGLGLACGVAKAQKSNQSKLKTFVLMGDAELSEGSVWEAAMFAAQHQLSNLVAIVDVNKIGSLDFTENYLALEPLSEKWESFGWDCVEVDGHDFRDLEDALCAVNSLSVKPKVILANTVKGKGIHQVENDPIWHVKKIDKGLYERALLELRNLA